MALINRVTRLFKADFHAVLDQIEEPELILKQAVREMEDGLAETEQHIRVLARDQEALTNRKAEIDTRLARLDEELDLCFASQKHELARNLIRKKLEAQQLSEHLGSELSAARKRLAEQREMLDENRACLESLRQKAELFTRRAPRTTDTGMNDIAWMTRELKVGDDEVEVAYLRELSARSSS
jgi:phage shock protein A